MGNLSSEECLGRPSLRTEGVLKKRWYSGEPGFEAQLHSIRAKLKLTHRPGVHHEDVQKALLERSEPIDYFVS